MSKRKRIKELESENAMLRGQLTALRKRLAAREQTITDVRKALGENGGSLVIYGGGGGGGVVLS
jgi:prefoldin subunit 5